MEVIDGNQIAAALVAELKAEVSAIRGRKPCITLVRVGEDPASVSYVKKKGRTAAEIGIESRVLLPPVGIAQAELEALVDGLNRDPGVDGILVQSPLPDHLDEAAGVATISPEKDVDGFHPYNLGKVVQGDEAGFAPCTPAGIMELLARSSVELEGRHVVVLGRSLIVGRPVALLALQRRAGANATVTVCHSKTVDLPTIPRQADVLIAAIGRAEFVTADMVKPGAVVIDVGINRVSDPSRKAGYRLPRGVHFQSVVAPGMVKPGAVVIDVGINRVSDPSRKAGYRLVGDVHFESVAPLVSKITPVPGGVGPMTVAMLMKNTVKAFRRRGGC